MYFVYKRLKMAKNGKKVSAPRKKANSYKKPPSIPPGEILQDTTGRRWKVGGPVGSGGFGAIYSACEYEENAPDEPSYHYVVKIEPIENGPLFVETNFYRNNYNEHDINYFMVTKNLAQLGMPTYFGFGEHLYKEKKTEKQTELQFLVLEKYGTDINKKFKEAGRFSVPTVFQLGLQMLDVLEYIHSRNYIHADIKGANILLGVRPGAENQAYLLDYGLAWRIKDDNYRPNRNNAHEGTLEYTSRDRHEGAQTMRGDLEILGYNMLQWLAGSLPWETLTDLQEVHRMKAHFMDHLRDTFQSQYPFIPDHLIRFFEYINTLAMGDVPNYTKCQKIFESYLTSIGKSRTSILEFSSQSIDPSSPETNAYEVTNDALKKLTNDSEVIASKELNDVNILPAIQKENEIHDEIDLRYVSLSLRPKRARKQPDRYYPDSYIDNNTPKRRENQDDNKVDKRNSARYKLRKKKVLRRKKSNENNNSRVETLHTEDSDAVIDYIDNNVSEDIKLSSPKEVPIKDLDITSEPSDKRNTNVIGEEKPITVPECRIQLLRFDDSYEDIKETNPGGKSKSGCDGERKSINNPQRKKAIISKKTKKKIISPSEIKYEPVKKNLVPKAKKSKINTDLKGKSLTSQFVEFLSASLSEKNDFDELPEVSFSSSSHNDSMESILEVNVGKDAENINEINESHVASSHDDRLANNKNKAILDYSDEMCNKNNDTLQTPHINKADDDNNDRETQNHDSTQEGILPSYCQGHKSKINNKSKQNAISCSEVLYSSIDYIDDSIIEQVKTVKNKKKNKDKASGEKLQKQTEDKSYQDKNYAPIPKAKKKKNKYKNKSSNVSIYEIENTKDDEFKDKKRKRTKDTVEKSEKTEKMITLEGKPREKSRKKKTKVRKDSESDGQDDSKYRSVPENKMKSSSSKKLNKKRKPSETTSEEEFLINLKKRKLDVKKYKSNKPSGI